MASELCEAADLFDYGVQPGTLTNPAREVASVDVTSNELTLDNHGFRDDAELKFRAESGGSMPAGLTAGVTYYAIVVDESTFQVAASAGGAAIDVTTAGSRVMVGTPLPFTASIRWASAYVEDILAGHGVPLDAPYPVVVVAAVAQLAAWKLLNFTGQSAELLTDVMARVDKQLDRWATGVALRGAGVPAAANLAASSVVVAARDPRGWVPEGGGAT